MSHYHEYNHNYCYSTVGNNCIPQTIALTSNTKFLSPLNKIYNEKYTENILLYPGHEEDKALKEDQDVNIFRHNFQKDDKNTCKSCAKY